MNPVIRRCRMESSTAMWALCATALTFATHRWTQLLSTALGRIGKEAQCDRGGQRPDAHLGSDPDEFDAGAGQLLVPHRAARPFADM